MAAITLVDVFGHIEYGDPKDDRDRWRHCLSRELLTEMECDVDASLAYFRQHGRYCDCEVLMNVDKR